MEVLTKHQTGSFTGRYKWCFSLTFLFIIATGRHTLAQAISISPSRMFFSGDKGQELSQQVILNNTGKALLSFKASLMDWSRDSTGEKHYYPTGTKSSSNAAWIEVMPNVVEIPPGTKQQVTVTMHVPKDAPANGVMNSMLFFTQINEQATGQVNTSHAAIGVIVKLEFGVHIYYTAPGLARKNLDYLAFYNDGTKTIGNTQVRRVAVKIKNAGNVVTDGFISLEATNKATGDEFKLPARAISMLPNDEQIVYLDLPITLKGHYLLVALLDSGEETNLKVAKKELDFTD